MKNFTLAQAETIVNTLISNTATNCSNITADALASALSSVKGTTFAGLTQASKVKTAAANKAMNIYKLTVQQVTLCNSDASLYANAVSREVGQAFESLPSNYDMLNGSYSVVSLKSNPAKHYIRGIVNNCSQAAYYNADTNMFMSKGEVADYLTPAASKQLLAPKAPTVVQHADVEHNVTTRTFALANIYSLTLNKSTLTA